MTAVTAVDVHVLQYWAAPGLEKKRRKKRKYKVGLCLILKLNTCHVYTIMPIIVHYQIVALPNIIKWNVKILTRFDIQNLFSIRYGSGLCWKNYNFAS